MDLDTVNGTIKAQHPELFQMFSALGRRAVFPRGIPFQAGEARDAEINATIGQITDGAGGPLPLPAVAGSLAALDPSLHKHALLYSPIAGHPELRERWQQRQRSEAGDAPESSLPIVTVGLTHGLSLVADLFVSPEMVVVLPKPFWGNYKQVFGLRRGAALLGFEPFVDGRFRAEGFRETLAALPKGPALVVLNFPSNPGGYSPTAEVRAQIVEGLLEAAQERSILALVDDAYHGLVYDEEIPTRSLFWDLIGRSPRLVPVKVCGTTKELVFFSGRVGFLTFGMPQESPLMQAMESKVTSLIRSTIGSPVGPSQALALAALRDPGLDAQFEEVRAMLGARSRAVHESYAALGFEKIRLLPCNSGCFALFELPCDSEPVRQQLLAEESAGMVSVAPHFLRLAFCSVKEDAIGDLLGRLRKIEDSLP